jgi:hypothetical protein
MDHRLSRLTSAATAAYGLFALVRPSHLPDALEVRGPSRSTWEALALTYGGRDVAVSAVGIWGSPQVVRVAMAVRIASDLTDGAILSSRTSGAVRRKAVAVTLAWAGINTAALVLDERGDGAALTR